MILMRQQCPATFDPESTFHELQQNWTLKFLQETQTTPAGRVPLQKVTAALLVKKFAKLYGIRGFITTFTGAYHWSLSSARWVKPLPIHLNITFKNLKIKKKILQSAPRTGKWFLSFMFFYQHFVWTSLSCALHAPAHLILLDMYNVL